MIPKNKKFGRIKPKYNATPNAAEKRYHDWMRELGCLVCEREPSIHHIVHDGRAKISKCHMKVAPLCWDHHQGGQGYHNLGHHKFTEMYGINLHDKATELLEEYKLLKLL